MARDTLLSGESKNIEYKVTLPDKSEKYMKTIVAFANTQGGKLIVGIDDKTHEIVGVENEILFQVMDGIANAISDSCVPQIIPDIEPQTVDGKTVIRTEKIAPDQYIENIELIGKALKKGKHKGQAMITAYDKKTGEIVGEVAVEMNITSE